MSSLLAVVGRVLRFFPGVVAVFVVVCFGLAVRDYFAQAANRLVEIQTSVTGGGQ